ncbi:DUF927 domain-containing protein [Paraburkholderia sp. SOS3]|uniref:DUF927 domain-containing protein n=1 Tax=Paraburkholderia sp. SOS3 TaxID=1926494 RepID=UPI0009475251|nr:DUF927 domain-containing protein [Paraburkholderia sp. SOS3]APR36687.1 hypothetical protein BTO02_16170 [Paraburkholderia sp. SOS3]
MASMNMPKLRFPAGTTREQILRKADEVRANARKNKSAIDDDFSADASNFERDADERTSSDKRAVIKATPGRSPRPVGKSPMKPTRRRTATDDASAERFGDGQVPSEDIRWLARVSEINGARPGHLVEIRALNDTWRPLEIPETLLLQSGELAKYLVESGVLLPNTSAAKRIVEWLRMCPATPRRIRAVNDGWVEYLDGEGYVFGDQMYLEGGEPIQVVRPQSRQLDRKGGLEGWLAITTLCRGNPLLILMMCVALAAPLLRLLGWDSFFMSLVGKSGTGKSTALRIAQAFTGSPAVLPTWEGTANGHEAAAARLSDRPVVRDELGQADITALDELIYRLANGGGKVRATSNGEEAVASRVLSTFMSAGEVDVVELLKRGGRQAKGGQLARFLTLPVDGEFGIFSELHGAPDGEQFARRISNMLRETYGVAWPAYVRHVAENRGGLEDEFRRNMAQLRALVSKGHRFSSSDGVCNRALGHFSVACFAGIVAIRAKVIDLEPNDIISAIRECFGKWLQRYLDHREAPTSEILAEIRELVLSKRNRMPPFTAFADASCDTRFGFTHTDRAENVLLVFQGALRAIADRYTKTAMDDALKSAGWLILGSGGRPAKQYKVPKHGNKKVAMYAIRESAIYSL